MPFVWLMVYSIVFSCWIMAAYVAVLCLGGWMAQVLNWSVTRYDSVQ